MKVKVSIVRCPDYDLERLKEALRKALDLIGGLREFMGKDDRVLVKPNMLSCARPESGIDTHPSVVRAVVELVKEITPEVLIGDSPGGTNRNIDNFYATCGFKEVAEATGAKLLNFERALREVKVPNGVVFKKLHIPRAISEVDVVISLPKLKTHTLTLYTGAVKNLLGLIPGIGKTEFHTRAPNPDDFGEAIVDILSVVKPDLAIMDGIIGMEGNGPVSNDLRKIGLLLASQDSVALDTVAGAIIGLKPFDVPTTGAAVKRGLGVGDLGRIEILGEPLNEAVVDGFKLPSNAVMRKIPKPILRFLGRGVKVRPVVSRSRCNRCGTCFENCPVKAINLTDDLPQVDYRKCILCLCCYELCPQRAVGLKRSILAKLTM